MESVNNDIVNLTFDEWVRTGEADSRRKNKE
jgi:hypothetical protein